MTRLTPSGDLASINDLGSAWMVAARWVANAWVWCGDLQDDRTRALFRSMAFPGPGEAPHVSVVTGREGAQLVLYARLWPVATREVPRSLTRAGRAAQ